MSFKDLTKAERKIYIFLMQQINKGEHLNIRELSRLTGYSTTTVMRLSKKIGYLGFSDMIFNLEFERKNQVKSKNAEQQNKKTTYNALSESLKNSVKLMDENSLLEIVELLQHKNVVLFGLREDVYALKYFQKCLLTLNIRAVVYSDIEMMQNKIKMMNESDLLFLIFNNLDEEKIGPLFLQAKVNKITMVGLFDHEMLHFSKLTNYYFLDIKHQENYESILYPIFIFEVLYESLFLKIKEVDIKSESNNIEQEVLNKMKENYDVTLKELSKELYVSESKVTKMAKEIGFSGYSDLRESLIENSNEKHLNLSSLKVMKFLISEKMSKFEETIDRINNDEMTDLAQKITTYNYVNIIGRGLSMMPASYLQDKLTSNSMMAIKHIDNDFTFFAIENMAAQEVLLIFSLGASSKHILKYLDQAEFVNVETALITSNRNMDSKNNIQVFICPLNKIFESQFYSGSRLQMFTFIEMLLIRSYDLLREK